MKVWSVWHDDDDFEKTSLLMRLFTTKAAAKRYKQELDEEMQPPHGPIYKSDYYLDEIEVFE